MKNKIATLIQFVVLLFFIPGSLFSQPSVDFTNVQDNSTCIGDPCTYEGPSILINEVMQSPNNGYDGCIFGYNLTPGDCQGEWIELFNPNPCEPIDISCFFMGNARDNGTAGDPDYLAGGFTLPETPVIIPPLGFCLIRGVNAPAVAPALLIQNGGNTYEYVLSDPNKVCMTETRLWFPNAGGWFAFYDNNGVAQDAIKWATESGVGGNPCVAPNDGCPFSGTLPSGDASATVMSIITNNPIPDDYGLTFRRIPDGGPWQVNNAGISSMGDCNSDCIDPPVITCDGEATASPSGGSPPYYYEWEYLNQLGPTISGLCEGEYCVTVTDALGNSAVNCVYIYNAPDPVLTMDSTNVTCYGYADGTAHVDISTNNEPSEVIWSNGESASGVTSHDISNLGPGTYIVTVTDAGYCTAIDTITIIEPPPLVITVGTDITICDYDSADIFGSVSGGTSPYNYQWDNGLGNGSGDYSAHTISPGTGNYGTTVFNVTFTDANSCTITDNITITSIPCDCETPPVPFNIEQPPCCGDNVTITYTGPGLGTTSGVDLIDPTYSWNIGSAALVSGTLTGSGVPGNLVVTPPGCDASYDITLTVTNHEGILDCIPSTYTATINVPPELTSGISGTNISCYGGNDGTITVTANGGTGGYNYNWSPAQPNSGDLSGLTAGDYIVTVSDDNNCTSVESITLTEPTQIVLTTDTVSEECGQCNGSATVTATGGTPPYTYLWSDPAAQTIPTAIDLCTGPYTVTVTDNYNCTEVVSVQIDPIDGPELSITGTDVLCYGGSDGSIDLTVTNGTQPYTYNWSNGAVTEDLNNIPAGDYYVTVTDDNNCPVSTLITITEPTQLVSTISGINASCNGYSDGLIDLSVSEGTPPYTYLWNTAAVTEDLNGVPAGDYSVVITDINSCTITNSITITEPTQLVSTISGINVSCYGYSDGSVDLNVSEGTTPYTYLWNTGAVTEDLSGVPAGDYSVVITDYNGCAITNTMTVTEPPAIVIDPPVTADVTCYGYSDGSITVTASGGTPPLNYNIGLGSQTNGTFSGLSAGNYTITVTDNNGCTNTITATINEPSQLLVTTEDTTICIGGTAFLTAIASGGTPAYIYTWFPGGDGQTNMVNPNVTTNYTVLVTDANNCVANAGVTVTVHPPLAIQVFPDDTICEGETATIYATYEGGMGEPYILTLNGSTTILIPYTVSPSITTDYAVCVNDMCETPQACDTLTVTVEPDPPVDFVADIYEGCAPLTVHFAEQNIHEGQTYQWDFGDPLGSTYAFGKYPVHTFENPGVYDVTCTVTSVHGCTSTWTWYEMISVWPNPVAAFLPYPQVATILNPLIFFENTSSTFYITNWTFGDGDSSNTIHPQHMYETWGTYLIQLAVETEHGCVDTAWTEIIIQDIITFYAPTAFSPDFDQMNGLFSPIGHGIDPDYWHLMIYDRWGEKVWETYVYDVDEETGEVYHGWDGTIRNRGIGETAVYTWLVIYRDVTGAEHQRAGLVTLIR